MTNRSEILAARLLEAFMTFRNNPAIAIDERSYSYAELYGMAAGMAEAIETDGGDEMPVAILGRKGLHTYAGICGSLFASRAYMPLNLRFPVVRNGRMLELSGANVIIADEHSAGMLEALLRQNGFSGLVIFEGDIDPWREKYTQIRWHKASPAKHMPPGIKARPEDIAYLLFTSGSTGTPKGVPVSNRNVTAYLDHILDNYELCPEDRFSQTFDLTFDLSVHDMMVCWLSGACLCPPEDDAAIRLAAYIHKSRISVWFSVPSVAVLMDRMRLLKNNSLDALRLSFFCGEALPVTVAEKWRSATKAPVVNLYGPSEATIAISEYMVGDSARHKNGVVSIGRLFPRQEYMLIDTETAKPVDHKGELCLSGTQVIAGYLNDPALNEKYFITAGEDKKKWYRTGDLVELDTDGNIFFMGRIDAEVKVSGFRVNLLEVDAVIRKYNGPGLVATLLYDTGTPRLVSFAERTGPYDASELIGHCRHDLPWYMIPEVIIFVDEMPLNANGKIDRKSLNQNLHG